MSAVQILQVCVVFVIAAVRAERSEEDSYETRSARQDKRGIAPQYSPYQTPNKASSYAHFAAAHQPLRPAPGHPGQHQGRPAPRFVPGGNAYSQGYVQQQRHEPPANALTIYPVFPSPSGPGLQPYPQYYPQQKPKTYPTKKKPIPAPESFLPPSAFAHFPPGLQNPVQTDTYFNYDEAEDA